MSKTLKWILGITLVLALMAAMFAIGYAWQSRLSGNWTRPFDRAWNTPMMERGRDNWRHPQIWDRGSNWTHPMMSPYGLVPFGGFFLLGGLVKFALFAGLLYGAYWLGRRNARLALDPPPAARVDASAAPEAEPRPRRSARKE